ncbi:DNA-processing protein DprA [Paracoccus sp. pheM1]|uniref:DNA-processing protein DprA n=1 Tax=Paracoccus sp. pheM1 TaxID=2831675 RepID=UPI001F0AE606|nr:DNA-processing protein DprA [Paracoccus sp. pheM1]
MMARQLSLDPHHGPRPKGEGLAALRLIRSRKVGPATFHRLLGEHGSAQAALAALPAMAQAAGIQDYTPCPLSVAEAEIASGRRAGARLVTWGDPDYPALLRTVAEAPPVLWLRGDMAVLERMPVAVIGARNASSLGLRMARGMAAGLSQSGAAVVAGLARGIDTVAHEAALHGGTIAVMAGGIDMIYPSENAALAEAICETGLLVTEQPPGTEPVARHFPARNRIISGLSRAVVVVEAAHRSGSLITARCALDQGREVMAVPGHPMDARAAGCNALIRDGALLVRNSADVLAALQSNAPAAAAEQPAPAPTPTAPVSGRVRQPAAVARRLAELGHDTPRPVATHRPRDAGGPVNLEGRILARLGPSPTEENMLIRDLGVPAAVLAPAILALELSGRVQRMAGGRLALSGG